MWPGLTMSRGLAPSFTAVSTVCDRSAALMPVVTPSRASMLMVKAVERLARFWSTIIGRSRVRMRSSVRLRQIRPRPCRAMKLIASGVHFSAAMTRSPSFSRSSSSTRITILPAAISSRAFATRSMASVRMGWLRMCFRS